MKEIPISELMLNPMTKIAKEWMLITAGDDKNGFNTMTASWGHMGSIWGHNGGLPTCCVYIRPQRYTKAFLDREPFFTISFYNADCKKALAYLGSHSGRDEDKINAAGLHPVFTEGCTTFREAALTLVCRKLYHAPIVEEGFLDRQIMEESYPDRDFHEMYIAEIVKAFVP